MLINIIYGLLYGMCVSMSGGSHAVYMWLTSTPTEGPLLHDMSFAKSPNIPHSTQTHLIYLYPKLGECNYMFLPRLLPAQMLEKLGMYYCKIWQVLLGVWLADLINGFWCYAVLEWKWFTICICISSFSSFYPISFFFFF